jgi:hypothetical protein
MIRKLLLAIGILLTTSMVSQAGMLACGPIYGGTNQQVAIVRVFNAGTTPITFLSKEILEVPNVVCPITGNWLPDILNPGEQGAFQANIAWNLQHAARLQVEGSAESVCAVMEIRTSAGTISVSMPLRPIR